MREAQDLRDLATARSAGVDIAATQKLQFYLYSWKKENLEAALKRVSKAGFVRRSLEPRKTSDGREYFCLIVAKSLLPKDLDAVFEASRVMSELQGKPGIDELDYSGWVIE